MKYLAAISLVILFLGNVLKSLLDKHIESRSKKTAKILKIGYWSVLSMALIIGIGKNVIDIQLQEGISLAADGRKNLHDGLDAGSAARIELSFTPLSRAIDILKDFSEIDTQTLGHEVMARHDLALGQERVAYSGYEHKCNYAVSNNKIVAKYDEGKSTITASPFFSKEAKFRCTDFNFKNADVWEEARKSYNSLYERLNEKLMSNDKLSKFNNIGQLAAASRSVAYFNVCDNLRTGGGDLEKAKQLFRWVVKITGVEIGNLPQRRKDANERLKFIDVLMKSDIRDEQRLPAECRKKGTVEPLSHEIRNDMKGKTWHENMSCPSFDELVLLRTPFIGFDGKSHVGELVVAKKVANDVRDIFHKLYINRFPINKMKRMSTYQGNDELSMNDNNTSAFNCRNVTGGTSLSQHSYGTAIDINPIQNPYIKDDIIHPGKGSNYKDRIHGIQGMILSNDIVTKSFEEKGWGWGGNWNSLKDYMHFSQGVE